MKLAPDEKFHGLRKWRESRNKRPISDDFGLRSPVIQETISNEKCYLYCSMRQSARSWRTLVIGSLSDDPVRRSIYDLRGQTQATVNEVLSEPTRREELRINEGKVMLATPSRCWLVDCCARQMKADGEQSGVTTWGRCACMCAARTSKSAKDPQNPVKTKGKDLLAMDRRLAVSIDMFGRVRTHDPIYVAYIVTLATSNGRMTLC